MFPLLDDCTRSFDFYLSEDKRIITFSQEHVVKNLKYFRCIFVKVMITFL